MTFSIAAFPRRGSEEPCVIISGLTHRQKSLLMVSLSTRAPLQTTPAGATTGAYDDGEGSVRVTFENFTTAHEMIALVATFLLHEGIGNRGQHN